MFRSPRRSPRISTSPIDIGAHVVFITLILIGLVTTKDWVIKTVVPVTFVLYVAYIALLFTSLPG